LHPQKTKIVYCIVCTAEPRTDRTVNPDQRFDFPGLYYVSTPTIDESHLESLFVSFSPAVRDKAARAKAMREDVRRWKLIIAKISPCRRRPMGTAYSCWLGQLYGGVFIFIVRRFARALRTVAPLSFALGNSGNKKIFGSQK